MDYNPTYFELLTAAETKGEKKSVKDRWIIDIKRQEYPKGATKEIISYIKTL
jgi:hypothetical protein